MEKLVDESQLNDQSGQVADVSLRSILERTSRSFFLGIEQLQEPLKHELTLAYLVCRLFDTFEDSLEIEPKLRLLALEKSQEVLMALDGANFSQLLNQSQGATQLAISNLDEAKLLQASSSLWTEISQLAPIKKQSFQKHLKPMLDGMYGEVQRRQSERDFRPREIQDFEAYCFYVAGTVGALITDLFRIEKVIRDESSELNEAALSFGHALQTVNIMKDFFKDWDEGRCFWPHLPLPAGPGLPPPPLSALQASWKILLERFQHYADVAEKYFRAIALDRRDAHFFCAFPFAMAKASVELGAADLEWLEKRGTFKLSREKTFEIFQNLLRS